MSADNGIYIAKFPDGYRVTGVVGNIENVWYHRPNTKARRRVLKQYFGGSLVYQTEAAALTRANEIYGEFMQDEEMFGMGCPIEYGICFLGEYESFEVENDG